MIYTIDLPDFGPVRFEQDEYGHTWAFGIVAEGGIDTDIPEDVSPDDFEYQCHLFLLWWSVARMIYNAD